MTQTPSKTRWIVNSETTTHITNSERHLNNTQRINSKIGVAKTNETITAKKIGSMSFETCNLKEVMYVPDLSANFLFVNAITESGGEVTFTKHKVKIRHNNTDVLLSDKKENGLYEIILHPEIDKSMMTRKDNIIENKHKKLGHLTTERMKNLLDISNGMDLTVNDLKSITKLCETYMKAKLSRLPFDGKEIKAKRPLELIHTNLCGPIDSPTWGSKSRVGK